MHPSFCVKDFLGVWPECHCLLNYFQQTYWSSATVISLSVYFFIPSVAPVGLRLTGESRRFTAELHLHARQPCWDFGSIVSTPPPPPPKHQTSLRKQHEFSSSGILSVIILEANVSSLSIRNTSVTHLLPHLTAFSRILSWRKQPCAFQNVYVFWGLELANCMPAQYMPTVFDLEETAYLGLWLKSSWAIAKI